mmetsp:Transcript_99219/g.309495  ORF Transcript_99219/g.309495 Transcript_99219/m.309495 type:complete len:389 (-) Transcript_99219:652-1818(-)
MLAPGPKRRGTTHMLMRRKSFLRHSRAPRPPLQNARNNSNALSWSLLGAPPPPACTPWASASSAVQEAGRCRPDAPSPLADAPSPSLPAEAGAGSASAPRAPGGGARLRRMRCRREPKALRASIRSRATRGGSACTHRLSSALRAPVLLCFDWCAGGGLTHWSGRDWLSALFLLALRSRAIPVTSISPSSSLVTAPPCMCELCPALPSPWPSMMHACRSVFRECSVSLLLGDTVAMTTVQCRSTPAKQPRNSCVRRFCRNATNLAPAAVARMHSLSAAREALILAPSFRRSALCSALSMRCSEPARSTRVRLPSKSAMPLPGGGPTKMRQSAWEREDWSCTPVAAVARSFVAISMSASSSETSCTSTSTDGNGCTAPSGAVARLQELP